MISFYGGEPLLNIKFIQKVIDYIESISIDNILFKYSMTTNATLLDLYMDYIVKKNISLLISLDGNKKANSYRINREGKQSFEKVMNNIMKLSKKYPEYFTTQVEFNSVLTNKSEVEFTDQYIYNKFKKHPTISELNTAGLNKDMENEFKSIFNLFTNSIKQSDNPNLLDEKLFEKSPYIMRAFSFLRAFSGNYFENYQSLIVEDKQRKFFPTGTCLPFEKKMFITVRGNILPCERIAHKYSLGHVSLDSVKISCKKIAKQYSLYYKSMKQQCTNCYSKPICYQCMFHVKTLMTKNVHCQGFTNKNEFLNNIQNTCSYLLEHKKLYKRLSTELLLSK